MHNTITSIDHPVIAVRSLDESRGVYERLGFCVPPRGSHVEWGTGNWCIMFRNDYLELRGIVDASRYTHGLEDHLAAHGEGLMGVAFGTTGADAAYEALQAAGLGARPVKALTRNFELPEGWVQPSFRLCFPDPETVEGLQHVVLCQHLTPDLIRRPEHLVHPNGVIGVAGLVGVVDDPDRIAAVQRRFMGDAAVSVSGDGVRLTAPSGQRIDLLTVPAFNARYGEFWPDVSPSRAVLPVLRLKVERLEATTACFDRAGVTWTAHDGAALVGPDSTCGVLMQFEQ
jgi:hypothetical protein